MSFIKPTKDKIALFIFMIIAAFAAALLFIFVSRFLAASRYPWEHPVYYQLIYFFLGILHYVAIAYLTIVFYKKKFSIKGEHYFIFKVVMLLAIFSFLHMSFASYISGKVPEIFFSNWVNVWFMAVNLAWYYLLACLIYYFDKNKHCDQDEK
jgi:hypothetical protein